MEMVKGRTLEIKAKYGDERRTDIDYSSGNIDITDLIPDESVVITTWIYEAYAFSRV